MATAKFKISDLSRVTAVNADDVFIINDSTGPETKSITFTALQSFLLGGDGTSGGDLEIEQDIQFNGNVVIEAERQTDTPQTADANLTLKYADIVMEDIGPHSIKFRDEDSVVDPTDQFRIQNAMDLTWRSSPNTLGFELANTDRPGDPDGDGLDFRQYRIFETYIDNPDGFDIPPFGQMNVPMGTTVFHANLVIDSRDNVTGLNTPNTNLTIVEGDIILRSGGPHKIRFIDNDTDLNMDGFDAEAYSGQVSPASLENSLDMSWRDTPNYFAFEVANEYSNIQAIENNVRLADMSVLTKVTTYHGQLHLHLEDVTGDQSPTGLKTGEIGEGSGVIANNDLMLGRGGFYMDGTDLKFKYKAPDGTVRTYTMSPD